MNGAELFAEFESFTDKASSEIVAKVLRSANDNKKTPRAPAEVLAAMKERFEFTWFDDVNATVTKEEIVKGFLGAGEFSLFVTKPGTAKSVLLCDIGCHIASGREWHGRKVKQGMVVFFAAERKSITERRVAAWRKRHGASGIPFVVAGGKLDMTSGLVDAKALASAIARLEESVGQKCVLVIIDTVTRTFWRWRSGTPAKTCNGTSNRSTNCTGLLALMWPPFIIPDGKETEGREQ